MRPTNILILLLCSINLISCSNKIGIGVHSVESGKSIFIPSEGYRERLINSSTEDCYFFTIQKVVDDALIRKRDCIGTIM